jgi:hypothetical protein
MSKPLRMLVLGTALVAAIVFPAMASAAVSPGTYTPTAGSVNPANAPGSSHLASGSASTRNGQLSAPAQSVSAGQVGQVCPNPNWTPVIRPGSLQLQSFTYTLTFAGFTSPYITITASWSRPENGLARRCTHDGGPGPRAPAFRNSGDQVKQ